VLFEFHLVNRQAAPHHETTADLTLSGASESVVDIARRICERRKVAILFSPMSLNPVVNSIDRVLYLGGGEAVIGLVDEVVILGPVLSRLYARRSKSCAQEIAIYVMRATRRRADAHRHYDHVPHPS